MIKKEELEELMKQPIFKKLIDNFAHQEKEITILKREVTKINKVLNDDFNKTLEKAISERVDKIINTLQNKPYFESQQ